MKKHANETSIITSLIRISGGILCGILLSLISPYANGCRCIFIYVFYLFICATTFFIDRKADKLDVFHYSIVILTAFALAMVAIKYHHPICSASLFESNILFLYLDLKDRTSN